MQVLLIDDEEAITKVFRQILEFEGHSVRTAPNGAAALELLRGGPVPDVILLDLMMPVMDGWEFLRNKNNDPRLRDVPVYVVSAFGDRQRAVDAQAFISKPVDMDELLNRLRDIEKKAS